MNDLYRSLLTLLNNSSTIEPVSQLTVVDSEWLNYEQLIERFAFRGIKSAKDAKWREKYNFPCSQSGKGAAVYFNAKMVENWITENVNEKKKR